MPLWASLILALLGAAVLVTVGLHFGLKYLDRVLLPPEDE